MAIISSLDMILSVVDSKYLPKVDFDLITKDKRRFNNCIIIAKKNGLYCNFVNRLKKLEINMPFLSVDDWDSELKRLADFKKSIELLNQVSQRYNLDYILIKDCNTLEHVPRDIDIFIREIDSSRAIEAFEESGLKYAETSITEMILQGDGYVDIEIYNKINYLGKDFIDEDFLFGSRLEHSVFGIKYYGLNNEANLILTLIHDLVGHRRITLLDFLHIYNIMENANITTCRQYVNQKGWQKIFDLTIDKLNIINSMVYLNRISINFPYIFEQSFMMKCLSMIDNSTSIISRLIIYLSLIQDGIVEQFKKTFLHDYVKSNKTLELALTSFINIFNFKKFRGDRHK